MKKTPQKLKLPGKLGPQTRWLVGYLIVMLLVTWGWQEFFGQFAVRTIPYSQFKAHLERREIVEAAVKQDEVVGRIVPLAARQTNAAPSAPVLKAPETNATEIPFGLRRALAETRPFLFRSVRVEDPDLVKRLTPCSWRWTASRPTPASLSSPPRTAPRCSTAPCCGPVALTGRSSWTRPISTAARRF